MDNKKKFWCAFSRLTKTSSAFVNKLYSHFGDIEYAWNADEVELKQVEGVLKSSVSAFINERKTVTPEECLEFLDKNGIDFLYPDDVRYPYALRHIENPPIGLLMKGDINNCNLERTLAVVGSRRASENSKITLRKILSDFHDSDICIVSGLAEGIDTVAHKSSVENNMRTIAVLGGGFNRLYPSSNKGLFDKILEQNGVILSEYWVDSEPISWHFPLRNRIVSGLSKGVLIAEAALKSGAMITAHLALEQGKELMCMPGLISNPNTQGIYKLIKDGAAIVTNYQDILDAMNWTLEKSGSKDKCKKDESTFTPDEQKILDCISKDALSIDELVIKTDLNINDLMVILTKLELEGIISRINGEKYISVK